MYSPKLKPVHCLVFLLLSFLGAGELLGEILTLTTGEVVSVASLTVEGDNFRFSTGPEAMLLFPPLGVSPQKTGKDVCFWELPRSKVRDISFSGQKRAEDVLGTETADLTQYMAEARRLLRKYPDSSSITVLDEGEFIHKADGTNVYRARLIQLIAKEESRGIGEVWVGFDPDREKVKILHARCLSTDGTCYSVSPEQIKVSKGSSGGEYFNNTQSVSFTIPQANVGTLVDYAYETEEFNPFDKNLCQGFFLFQGGEPVYKSVMRVKVPRDQSISYVPRNCPDDKAKPVEAEEGPDRVYTWQFTDLPPIVSEPCMPALRDISPGMAFSLQKDWTYMFNRLRPMFEKRFQLTEPVKRKVEELVADARTLEEKIARIYRFCQKEIRYISIKGSLASNQVGHPAEDTLKNRYGDCTDKGMLLATMLKHIGVEAYPVGIRTNPSGRAIREIPIFDSDHCITEVHLNGKRSYLDSTATDYRYPYFRADDHDTMTENAVKGTIDQVPLPPPEDNALRVKRDLTLAADGTTKVDFECEVNGSAESSFRHSARSMKPEEYEKSSRATISAMTADYVLEIATHSDPLNFSAPFKTVTKYTLNRFGSRSGRFMIFEIPQFRVSFPEVSLAERKYDIVYTTTNLRTDEIGINLPPGFSVKYMPPPLKVATPYIEFDCSYRLEGSKISLNRRLAVLNRIVPVKDYSSHRETLEKIAKYTEERLFLEASSSAGGEK